MSKVCYCNDCLLARSEKKRLPFTSGDNIFITGTLLSPSFLNSNIQHIPASPNRSFAENLSDKSGTSKIPYSLSENIISNSTVSNRRSLSSPRGPSPRDGVASPLRRSGSVRLPNRTLGSLSNVSVLGGGSCRPPPSYHSPRSYSALIVITARFLLIVCLSVCLYIGDLISCLLSF